MKELDELLYKCGVDAPWGELRLIANTLRGYIHELPPVEMAQLIKVYMEYNGTLTINELNRELASDNLNLSSI